MGFIHTRENFPVEDFKVLQSLLLDLGILQLRKPDNGKLYRRISMWKSKWTEDIDKEFKRIAGYLSCEEELWYCLISNVLPITEDYICPVCHNAYVKFLGGRRYVWRSTCADCSPNQVSSKKEKGAQSLRDRTPEAKEATRLQTRQTLLERYGDADYGHIGSQSFQDNLEKKYGDKNYRNWDKIRATHMERRGVPTNLLLPEVREKAMSEEAIEKGKVSRRRTNLERYGVEAPAQLESVREKQIKSKRSKVEAYAAEHDCTLFKDLLCKYGQGWLHLDFEKIHVNGNTFIPNSFIPMIEQYVSEGSHTNDYTSKGEKEVAEFVRSLGVTIEENNTNTVSNRNGRFYELDVYIPEKRIAIDFDGIYWHSSLFKDKNYHKRKSDYCREDGIRMIHVFEDLWNSKRPVYQSIIKSALGIYDRRIYARKCEVVELTSVEYRDFLEKNHLHGAVSSAIRLGLKYQGELVQVVGFGKSRFKKDEFELHRMCSLLNTQIVGGFSKLIKASGIKQFISYVDLAIYDGQGYKSVGFTELGMTDPGYIYYKDGERYSRIAFQKGKLSSKLEIYDESLSEYENMLNNGYLQIYDSGNLKVLYREEV